MKFRQILIQHPLLWSFIVTVVALYAAIFILMPHVGDDLVFLSNIYGYSEQPDGSIDYWEGIKGCWVHRFEHDNSRLANIAVTPVLLFPRWVIGLLNAFAVGFFIYIVTRIVPKDRSYAFATVTAVTLYTIVMPWPNYFFTAVFAFNYVWGGMWLALTVWMFIRPGNIPLPVAGLLGFVCGAWHEAFGLCALSGLCLVYIVDRRYRRQADLWIIVGLIVGLLWLLAFRNIYNRVSDSLESVDLSMLRFTWTLWLMVGVWLVMVLRRKWRAKAMDPILLICVSGSLCEVGVGCIIHIARVVVPAMVLSIIGLSYMAASIRPTRRIKAVTAVMAMFLVAHLGVSAYYTAKINKDIEKVFAVYLSADCKDGVVFADVTYVEDTHWLALRKPVCSDLHLGWDNIGLYTMYEKPRIKVIPTALKNYRPGDGDRLDEAGHLYLYKGHIVTDLRFEQDYEERCGLVRFDSEQEAECPIGFFRFTSDSGDTLMYGYIRRAFLQTWAGPPRAIDLKQ